MKRLRLAIVGFGRLGRACAQAIVADPDAELAGLVRRPVSLKESLPPSLRNVAVVGHISELQNVDAALVCVPQAEVLGVAEALLQRRVPIVECASLHDDEFARHKQELNRVAELRKSTVIVGAGWDPGALSMLRTWFHLLTPKGETTLHRHVASGLHHTTAARNMKGVRDALVTELQGKERMQRYVYVELERGADFAAVERSLRADPLFLDEETFVFVVDSIAGLEQEDRGIVLERYGSAAGEEHQMLLLEARFSEYALSAQVMLAAAHALNTCHHQAYSLGDLPLNALWGRLGNLPDGL